VDPEATATGACDARSDVVLMREAEPPFASALCKLARGSYDVCSGCMSLPLACTVTGRCAVQYVHTYANSSDCCGYEHLKPTTHRRGCQSEKEDEKAGRSRHAARLLAWVSNPCLLQVLYWMILATPSKRIPDHRNRIAVKKGNCSGKWHN
jgi:hypothetical protein